jgi:GNAT superfamily N-acetyltransferase
MEFSLLGWPPDGPTLELDWRRFSYAGKFVMSSTGKTVVRTGPDGDVVGAVAFNEDRTDPDTLWLRYVTVREDYRGEGVGPPLLSFTVAAARERGYERIRIAVNNPFAYQAAYKAGFGFTGEETGIAELVLQVPAERDAETYQRGLDVFRARDLDEDERSFLDAKADSDPPAVVDAQA